MAGSNEVYPMRSAPYGAGQPPSPAAGSAQPARPPLPGSPSLPLAVRMVAKPGSSGPNQAPPLSLPPRPTTLEETDLDPAFLEEHALKVVATLGTVTGNDLAEHLHLPLAGVVEPIIGALRRENLIEPVGGGAAMIGAAGMILRATERGAHRAHLISERNGYAGPAPVSLNSYVRGLKEQVSARRFPGRDHVWRRLAHLVLADEIVDRVGLGVESGGPIFIYGNPGNGKTAIAAAIARILGGEMLVPYAVEVDGHVFRVFDSSVHRPLPVDALPNARFDDRWALCQVPFVQVGGELRLDQLDLTWNERQRFYDSPIQVKAAGGVLLVDDFGRQAYPPDHLLNRWIVPLETGIDYLTLATGRQVALPFTSMLVFATNLTPRDLVDEAFLRRLPCKVEVPDPSADAFHEIFRRTSAEMGVEFNEAAFAYLVDRYYTHGNRVFRASQPRDILRLMLSSVRYFGAPALMTAQLMDVAAGLYFV
ncbi:MAG TPA: hypothetical protein VGN32_03690 [Ktedonobacterales bacterium]|nr:hypothetical protein [Ktedonobacterales bacterium]